MQVAALSQQHQVSNDKLKQLVKDKVKAVTKVRTGYHPATMLLLHYLGGAAGCCR